MKNVLTNFSFLWLALSLFCLQLALYFWLGVTSLPKEGDSLAYHIPIAMGMLHGNLWHPTFYLGFYPSIAETILSVFILLHLPLNIFNVVAIGLVFLTSFLLARQLGLSASLSGFTALSIALLPALTRWYNAQIIDIWLLVFFLASIWFIEQKKMTRWIALSLGISLGCLIGVKYTGVLYVVILLFVYRFRLKEFLRNYRWLFVLVPVCLLGFSWFVRNWLLMGNPLYPQPFLWMRGYPHWNIFEIHMIQAIVFRFPLFFNAVISEYLLWPIVGLMVFVYRKKISVQSMEMRLVCLGLLCGLVWLLLPTTYQYNIIVSSFRYGYPMIVPLMLVFWKVFVKIKKVYWLVLLTLVSNLLPWLSPYHPKLILLFVPAMVLDFCLTKFVSTHKDKFATMAS